MEIGRMTMDLTIAIVNYNSKDFLQRCLQSLRQDSGWPSYQVVVVDNASEDRDFSEVSQEFPQLQLIQNSSNLGFSVACNQAIQAAPASFYLLLNPDTVVLDSAVRQTLSFLKREKDVGIAGCRILNPDGSLQLASRRTIPTPRTALFRLTGLSLLFPSHSELSRYNLTHLDPALTVDVEAVSGSFLMFRHELLNQIGGLDERFFLYGEDLDFCYRAHQSGWRVTYFADAAVRHFKTQSSNRSLAASTSHFFNAMRIFYDKHYGPTAGFLQRSAVHGGIRILYWLRRGTQLLGLNRRAGSGV